MMAKWLHWDAAAAGSGDVFGVHGRRSMGVVAGVGCCDGGVGADDVGRLDWMRLDRMC